ncbi:hypothetical protein FACS1894110_10770 [Spirochaetia bacterium]|nr:hypothetical protein FACS1894110_10770 [Spirochaetia bacterium]
MKKIYLSLIVLSILLISACTSIDLATYEDEKVYAELENNNAKLVTLKVKNQTGTELTILPDRISYSADRKTNALVPEGTVKPVASRGTESIFFVDPQAVTVDAKSGKRKVAKWVPDSLKTSEFKFGYRIGETDGVMIFPDPQERTLAGKVNVSNDFALPVFTKPEARRTKLYNMALEQAQASFGAGIRLANVRYDSTINFFVDKATLSADVIKTNQ